MILEIPTQRKINFLETSANFSKEKMLDIVRFELEKMNFNEEKLEVIIRSESIAENNFFGLSDFFIWRPKQKSLYEKCPSLFNN